MPFITRDDGEHFVIPSYRDVLTVKNNSALKKEILTLSQSYGEYITLQRKSSTIYDVAFSPDMGYLLGESLWHYFKRPLDMIYCEAVPNTTEAILVIVKDGGVYLDGRFSMDSIPEELIIFLTQKNNFEISIYGDVPLSEQPAEGKFSFDVNSVKSFTILKEPVFPTLPLLKTYQFQLVESTLKRYGIGGVPLKKVIVIAVLIAVVWFGWSFISSLFKTAAPLVETPQVNPYQGFYDALRSPAPDTEVSALVSVLNEVTTIPGWNLARVAYASGSATCAMQSSGATVDSLIGWADQHQAAVDIVPTGVTLTMPVVTKLRPAVNKIYSTNAVLATLLDRLAAVYPGNNLQLAQVTAEAVYTTTTTTITLTGLSLSQLDLIGQQLHDLPLVITGISLDYAGQVFGGSINLQLLGS